MNLVELSREDVERIQAIIRRFISSPDHESTMLAAMQSIGAVVPNEVHVPQEGK